MIRVLKYLLAILILFFFLFPVYWLLITAFKHSEEWFSWPPILIPTALTLNNFLGLEGGFYGGMASVVNITPYLRNSVVVATVTALTSTIIGAAAAYAISRFKIGGIHFANWVISIRMLPPVASALPLYLIFSELRLLNTQFVLILAHLVFTAPLSTWILITFFNDIPRELDEAALVDGASPLSAFFHIILPLSAPGLAAVATLAFIQSWGEFLLALVLTSNADAQTLPIYLGRYITGFRIAWGPLAAAGLINMVPVILFSLLMQRYLIRGLTFGAIKG
ncbi:MAG: carbohydrate ABC transporter permease [Anaerolineae bacterium]|nr:carbohydrate ABC transporter permease [Anaerolineae bacterium]